jgi:hypothetical protein
LLYLLDDHSIDQQLRTGLQQYLERALPLLVKIKTFADQLPTKPDLSTDCITMVELSENMADSLQWATDGTPRITRTSFTEMHHCLNQKASTYTKTVLERATRFMSTHDTFKLREELVHAINLAMSAEAALRKVMFPDSNEPVLDCDILVPWWGSSTLHSNIKFRWTYHSSLLAHHI